MKNALNSVLFLIAGTFTFHTAMSQQVQLGTQQNPITLQQLWDKAASTNKTVLMRKLEVQAGNEELKDAKTEKLPDIKAYGEYARVSNMPLYENGLLNKPEQFPVLHTYYKVGGDAYLKLYNRGKTNNKIAEQKTLIKIKEEQQSMTTSSVKLQATGYYLDLVRGKLFKQYILSHIADEEKQLQHIRQLQKSGVILKSDVLRAELQLSKLQLSLHTIENDLAIANQKLNLLLGQNESIENVPVSNPGTDSLVLKSYEDYLNDAFLHSYNYKISEGQTELKALQVKDVKANLSPKIGLFANYNYAYPEIQFYPYGAALYGLGMAGVRASFPISGFYQNKHKVKASELEYKAQELEHANTADVVRQQVNESYLRYKEALDRMDVAKKNIDQAVENARIVHNTYFNQLSLITDLLDADTQVLQTRFDLVAAQTAAAYQYYQLQNAIGNL